ncbi:MAG: NAD(P)H-dependent oxidoreductase [Proteobacteria bacterium]|nr:NAD(P)H-dependent oxidoreductase [Pseudomonadota bacterium]
MSAHPVETSFNAAIQKTAIAALERAGHVVDHLDLYAENFNPVLSREERLGYHEIPGNRGPVQQYVDRLMAAEGIVFVFPTWCYGVPAILKGWFDRVLLPGVSFNLGEDGIARPALTHIKRVIGISTFGRPWWVATFLVGNPPKKQIMRYFRLLTAGRAKMNWLAHYDMNRATDKTRGDFLTKIDRTLGDIR